MTSSLRLVTMRKRLILRRGGPDVLTEELVGALSGNATYEFKPLFVVVYGNLQARKAAHGGEDMLRLRLYERLQSLVQTGSIEKEGKSYRGNVKLLRPLMEQIAARHCEKLLDTAVHFTVEAGLGGETGISNPAF
jgi:hypothetical protein